jgi:hypothetical protein
MKAKTFSGNTLEEAKKAKAHWLLINRHVKIKREYDPVLIRESVGGFTTKANGDVLSASIRVDYDVSN